MTKMRVLTTLVLIAVLGTFGAVYQFYFKEKLEMYSRDQELLAALESAYKELEGTFAGYRPDVLTTAWREQRPAWTNAVEDRAGFFNVGDWFDHERPPENVPILRFWYGDEANEMVNEIYQRLATDLGYGRFPFDLYAQIGVPRMEEYQGYNVKPLEVNKNLDRLSLGISIFELLLEAKATMIQEVVLWPSQQKPEHEGLLFTRTVGLAFSMTMENLVRFMEELRTAERYYSVDALQVDYPYIAYPQEPQVQVKMLLTIASFKKKAQEGAAAAPGAAAGAAGAAGAGGAGASAEDLFAERGLGRGRTTPPAEEPGFFGKAWKWFKRVYLGMN